MLAVGGVQKGGCSLRAAETRAGFGVGSGDDDVGGACAFNNFVDLIFVPNTTIMAPKFLTGDKAGIDEFLNKFDVCLDA